MLLGIAAASVGLAGGAAVADEPGFSDATNRVEQQASDGEHYVVREGDTLAGLAERFLGSAERWQQLAERNGIEDPKDLEVGQKLTIPKSADADETR